MSTAKTLRKMLAKPEMMVVPGVHDGLSAQLARNAGFESLFLGSYAITASAFGMPDSGLVPVAKLIEAYRTLVEATELPALCDIDDGGGSPLHIARNIRLVEQAGIAGVQMEDLDLSAGKYLPGTKKRLIASARMVSHIKAATDARRDPDTLIMARCDACDAATLSEAIDRVGAYGEAGADLILIPFLKIEEIPQIIAAVPTPLAHMFLPTDAKDAVELERARAFGVKYLMYPVLSVWSAGHAIQQAMLELRNQGSDATRTHGGATWALINNAVRSDEWSRFAQPAEPSGAA